MAEKPKSELPICTSCGGSGTSFQQWGPFYSSVQKRWRQTVRDHTEARHEVFRTLDRRIAGQVIPLAKDIAAENVSIADILAESDAAAGKAAEAHQKGDITAEVRALAKVAISTIYVLESLEIELNKHKKPQD